MGCPLLLCLAALLFMSSVATELTTELTGPLESPLLESEGEELHIGDGEYATIQLQKPFRYAGNAYSVLYLSMNGYVSFSVPNFDEERPDPHLGKDVIAPLWADLEADTGGRWTYEEATNGSLIEEATESIKKIIPNEEYFSASWVFVSTWENVSLENSPGFATFQVVLISDDEDHSFIIMNYEEIPSIPSSYWLAGYDTENTDFYLVPVNDSFQLSSHSNVNISGCWVFPVTGPPVHDVFYSIWDGTEVDFSENNGSSSPIALQQAFQYFGSYESTIYVNKNGFLSFSMPLGEATPDMYPDISADIIAPLWTDFEIDDSDKVVYKEVTEDSRLLDRVTQDINAVFPGSYFYATWLFIASWERVSFANGTGSATFQTVLVSSSAGVSYVMFNYGQIDSTDQYWVAGYKTMNGNYYFIPETDTFNLSSTSNVEIPGRWVFQAATPVTSLCETLACTLDEVCMEINGAYGCACGEYNTKPNPDFYDATETCSGNSGSLSLSRCQLFEAGYSVENLHLNDPNCRGQVQYDRLVFYFDSYANMCGTTLQSNSTHIIFKNNVGTTDGMGVISHIGGLNIGFSCVYPLIQSISMPMPIQAIGSVINKEVSTLGSYQISMIPYPDSTFQNPFTNNITLQVNQPLYIAVHVDGFDNSPIALVMDSCWATPIDQTDFYIRWDLIINDCPNPADSTVEVLQNGVSTSSFFSFKMFTFTGFSNNIYLHCQVHLCLLDSGNCAPSCNGGSSRRRRSADLYDSAAISMGF